MTKIRVTQPENPAEAVPIEILATAVTEIARAFKKINEGPLKRKALLVLLKDSSGVPMNQITRVLDSLTDLERNYCK
jgi:hypothetical protein